MTLAHAWRLWNKSRPCASSDDTCQDGADTVTLSHRDDLTKNNTVWQMFVSQSGSFPDLFLGEETAGKVKAGKKKNSTALHRFFCWSPVLLRANLKSQDQGLFSLSSIWTMINDQNVSLVEHGVYWQIQHEASFCGWVNSFVITKTWRTNSEKKTKKVLMKCLIQTFLFSV